MVFANTTDIILCEADSCYTKFHLKSGETILVTKNLKEYEDLLSHSRFFRPHRSFLINIKEVKKLNKKEGNCLVMSNNVKSPLSKRKKETFLELIGSNF